MSIKVAIDVSTVAFGFAYGDDLGSKRIPNIRKMGVFKIKGKDFITRIAQIPELVTYLKGQDCSYAFDDFIIEKPAVMAGRSHDGMLACFSAAGVCAAAIRRTFPKATIKFVAVSSWRPKFLSGHYAKGKMPKGSDALKKAVKEILISRLFAPKIWDSVLEADKGFDASDACAMLMTYLDFNCDLD